VSLLEQVVTTAQGGVDAAVANGMLVYVRGGVTGADRSLVWVDRTGREEPVPAPPRAYQYPRISPDETRVALDVRDQENDIWIWDFTRTTFTRFTFDPGGHEYPVWMPDGRRLVFGSGPPNAQNLFWKAADGTGVATRLTESPNDQDAHSVTPDGTVLIFRETGNLGSTGAARWIS
jgi:Tol biopolymer transport system component